MLTLYNHYFLFPTLFLCVFGALIVIFLKNISRQAKILQILGMGMILYVVFAHFSPFSFLPLYQSSNIFFFLLLGIMLLFLGYRLEKESFSIAALFRELRYGIILFVLFGVAASTISGILLTFYILRILIIVDLFFALSLFAVGLLLYVGRKTEVTYLSFFAGIILIILSFFPAISFDNVLKMEKRIDIGGIIFGVIFLAISVILYKRMSKRNDEKHKIPAECQDKAKLGLNGSC